MGARKDFWMVIMIIMLFNIMIVNCRFTVIYHMYLAWPGAGALVLNLSMVSTTDKSFQQLSVGPTKNGFGRREA